MAYCIGKGCNTLSVGSHSAVILIRSLALSHARSVLGNQLAKPPEESAIPLFRVSLKFWNLLALRGLITAQSGRKRIIARCAVLIPPCRLLHSLETGLRLRCIVSRITHVRSLDWSQSWVGIAIPLRNELFLLRHLVKIRYWSRPCLHRLRLKLSHGITALLKDVHASHRWNAALRSTLHDLIAATHNLIIVGVSGSHHVQSRLRIPTNSNGCPLRLLCILIVCWHSLL